MSVIRTESLTKRYGSTSVAALDGLTIDVGGQPGHLAGHLVQDRATGHPGAHRPGDVAVRRERSGRAGGTACN